MTIPKLRFLYSQDLSNYKTELRGRVSALEFLYSQDLSNYKTRKYKYEK